MFTTKKQIDEYFATEKIQCLVCGKFYWTLGTHLLRIHDMSCDDYKSAYGLPFSKGLAGAVARAKSADSCRARVANGEMMDISLVAHMGQQSPNRTQPFSRNEKGKRFSKFNTDNKKAGYDDMDFFMSYLENNKVNAWEIVNKHKELELISPGTFWKRKKDFKEIEERYRDHKKNTMPIQCQARFESRETISAAVVRMKSQGVTIGEISERLLIGRTTVKRILSRVGAWSNL